MSYLVVPSDITVLEDKTKVGRRNMGLLERIGLMLTFPVYHANYTKLDKGEIKSVLTKKYDKNIRSEANEICMARQAAVSRQVKAHIGWWAGGVGSGLGVFWSFRKYNYQSKLICIPFLAYAGAVVGREVGNILAGRNQEFYRDRFLGQLPAKCYYAGES